MRVTLENLPVSCTIQYAFLLVVSCQDFSEFILSFELFQIFLLPFLNFNFLLTKDAGMKGLTGGWILGRKPLSLDSACNGRQIQ